MLIRERILILHDKSAQVLQLLDQIPDYVDSGMITRDLEVLKLVSIMQGEFKKVNALMSERNSQIVAFLKQ